MNTSPAASHGLDELRVLGQEAVPRMHRLRARYPAPPPRSGPPADSFRQAGAPPIRTASSAMAHAAPPHPHPNRRRPSRRPCRRHVRITRHAISPRFAIRTLRNMRPPPRSPRRHSPVTLCAALFRDRTACNNGGTGRDAPRRSDRRAAHRDRPSNPAPRSHGATSGVMKHALETRSRRSSPSRSTMAPRPSRPPPPRAPSAADRHDGPYPHARPRDGLPSWPPNFSNPATEGADATASGLRSER